MARARWAAPINGVVCGKEWILASKLGENSIGRQGSKKMNKNVRIDGSFSWCFSETRRAVVIVERYALKEFWKRRAVLDQPIDDYFTKRKVTKNSD